MEMNIPKRNWALEGILKFYRRHRKEHPEQKKHVFHHSRDGIPEEGQHTQGLESAVIEIEPLTKSNSKGESESSKSAASTKTANLYVKGPERRTSDIKYIEEDESECSELLAVGCVDSRESSTAPRGDNLPEYEVEELREMLITHPIIRERVQPPIITIQEENCCPNHPEERKPEENLEQPRCSPEGKRKYNFIQSCLTVPKLRLDNPSEHVYSAISESVSHIQPPPQPHLSRPRSTSPEVPFRRRTFGEGENLRRLQSSPLSEQKEEEEALLEALRQVVRKCSNVDPLKRPTSSDLVEMLSSINEKS